MTDPTAQVLLAFLTGRKIRLGSMSWGVFCQLMEDLRRFEQVNKKLEQ